jgi:hypothetical protein
MWMGSDTPAVPPQKHKVAAIRIQEEAAQPLMVVVVAQVRVELARVTAPSALNGSPALLVSSTELVILQVSSTWDLAEDLALAGMVAPVEAL